MIVVIVAVEVVEASIFLKIRSIRIPIYHLHLLPLTRSVEELHHALLAKVGLIADVESTLISTIQQDNAGTT